MATHGDEKVKEDLATLLHLGLHRRALLEIVTIANDDRKVMTS